jgi:hypothetical protein
MGTKIKKQTNQLNSWASGAIFHTRGSIPQGLYQVQEDYNIVLNSVEVRRENSGWTLQ